MKAKPQSQMIPVDGVGGIHVRADGYSLIPVEAGREQHRDLRGCSRSRGSSANPLGAPSAAAAGWCGRRPAMQDLRRAEPGAARRSRVTGRRAGPGAVQTAADRQVQDGTARRNPAVPTATTTPTWRVSQVIVPMLGAAGLAWITKPTSSGDLALAYRLLHTSGGSEEGLYPLPSTGSPQEIGSAITYARRYTLCSVTGVAPEQDDETGRPPADKAKQAAAAPPSGSSRRQPRQRSHRPSRAAPRNGPPPPRGRRCPASAATTTTARAARDR